MFRVGVLYRVIDLLEFLKGNALTHAQFDGAFPSWRGVSGKLALETALACGWIEQQPDGQLLLSGSGDELRLIPEPAAHLRCQLGHLIALKQPSWTRLTLRGRDALRLYGPNDVVQCFDEAGLFDRNDSETVRWWDALSHDLRGSHDRAMMDTGREGERRSIEYEEGRTSRRPRWVALDNSDAGYDVLSSISGDDAAPLAIEVKSSRRPWQSAEAYLTRNEWDVLHGCQTAVLHLWCLGQHNALFAAVRLEVVERHVAADRGNGKWQEVLIPFRSLCVSPTRFDGES